VVRLTVNGEPVTIGAAGDMPLLWYLRDALGLTGTKFGCGIGACGACTVHVDGAAVRSCVTPIASLNGRRVTTIEGLSAAGDHLVQQAWRNHNVPQCGFCQAGQIMQATAFLEDTPNPSDEDIEAVMAGNICRCGTYLRIKAAIKDAAIQKANSAEMAGSAHEADRG